ncbi:MAG TPA: OmpH family outer membrane protein [Steroidobacteraceae bacterium]|nr:OmpH family outer membrane protein [Steroidobacteraceae bacterium]
MVKSVLWGTVAALAVATSPAWAELKIGYVNFQLLAARSPQAQAIQNSLNKEFGTRGQALAKEEEALKARADKFQRDAATMTDEQRDREQKYLRDTDRDVQAKKSELQDDFNQRKNEELSRLQKALIEQVQTYAKAQGFDIVLAGDVIYATPTIDLTSAVLERLKDSSGSAAAPTSGSAAPRAHKPSGRSK